MTMSSTSDVNSFEYKYNVNQARIGLLVAICERIEDTNLLYMQVFSFFFCYPMRRERRLGLHPYSIPLHLRLFVAVAPEGFP